MAQNNLRIIYDNVIDSATLTATSAAAGLPVTNLQLEQKGFVWRATSTSATITAVWDTSKTLNSVVLPFCNLTASATINIKVYTNAADVTPALDVTASAGAYVTTDLWGGSAAPSGVNAYSFGGGSYARRWFSTVTGKKLEITISDSTNPSGYIEASRIVCGQYWAPVYNTSFGVTIGYIDNSIQSRTEAGNLVTSTNAMHRTLAFNLDFLTDADRVRLLSILRGNGIRKPLFVSVFPEDADIAKEQNYQIYGKMTNLNQINHPVYTIYASSLNLEEI
jgi:hypothetical protein